MGKGREEGHVRKPRTGVARCASAVELLVATLLVASLPAPLALASEGCSNEARRAEQSSTYLPNCRAYELVTPVDKDAGEPEAVVPGLSEREPLSPIRGARAAADGERMAWQSEYSLPGLDGASTPGLEYLSTRGPEGWSTEATVPPQSPENGLLCPYEVGIVGWSADLTAGILADGNAQEAGESGTGEAFYGQAAACGHAEPALREADGAEIVEPTGFQNLFLRDDETRSYQLVNVTPSTAPRPRPSEGASYQPYFPANFLAGSTELEHVAFEDELPLTEEAERLSPAVEAACAEEPKGRDCWEGHINLYVWSAGQQPAVRLVTVLPNGDPVEGTLAGSTRNAHASEVTTLPRNVADYRHAVSANGARIFFEAEGNLYVRENAGEPQSKLGAKDVCIEPMMACTIQLDARQGGSGPGGGKWLGANGEGTKVFFTDEASASLTTNTQAGSGVNLYEYELPSEADVAGTLIDLTPDTKAEVLGMSGISEDGSNVYFVASGRLAGEDTVAGRSPEEAEPSEGADNLYISHEGTSTFIAALSDADECDWTSDTGCNLEEPSNPRITGLTSRVSGNGHFLAFNSVNTLTGYANVDTVTKQADEEIFLYKAEDDSLACVSCNPSGAPSAGGAAIDWPASPDQNGEVTTTYPQHNVSESGEVFFETSEDLLPRQDTSGQRDVYAYERGALQLISGGTSSAPSYFLDATPSGSGVFFATAQKLLRRDTEATYNIYDARVGGGFAEPSLPVTPCESECRSSVGASSAFLAPDSVTFVGSGNAVRLPNNSRESGLKAKRGHEAKLRRALQTCARHHRHSEYERARCERRVRRRRSQRKANTRRHDLRVGG